MNNENEKVEKIKQDYQNRNAKIEAKIKELKKEKVSRKSTEKITGSFVSYIPTNSLTDVDQINYFDNQITALKNQKQSLKHKMGNKAFDSVCPSNFCITITAVSSSIFENALIEKNADTNAFEVSRKTSNANCDNCGSKINKRLGYCVFKGDCQNKRHAGELLIK